MIGYRNYTDGTEADYQYSGLRRAQMAAQNFTAENIGDDIPLIFTMAVHSEQYIDGVTNNYIDGPHRRRAPTWSEIFAQGNIAIAYGAKGFMYYMIPTRTTTPDQNLGDKDTVWNTYGLFDEAGNRYDTSHTTSSGKIQNPAALQVPNSRYDAVKAFINSTNLIASELLQLKWINANSWSNPTPGIDNYINTVVATRVHSSGTIDDESYETYVESGYFLKPTSATATVEDERFVYLVNRRCNQNKDWLGYDNSDRIVSFFVTQFKDYVNYKITDLKSNTVYYKTYNQQFTIHLDAGEGTLLKIEPVVHSGGTLLENETVKHQVDVKSTLMLSSGKTLTITNGADMKFLNSSKLDVSSANLYIFTTGTGSVKLDFVSRNWTAGNGIIASGANVSINNTIIKNASTAIAAWNPASLSISNSTIENCWFGVSVESRPVGSIYLDNVKVLGCSERGVTLGTANLEIKNSRISGSQIALNAGNGIICAGDYGVSQSEGLDTLADNDVGIYSYASQVDFGSYLGQQDYNSINNLFSGNGTNITALSSSEVSAEHNYWDDISDLRLDWDLGSKIFTDPVLEEGSDNPQKEDESDLLSGSPKLSNGEGNTVKEKIVIIRQLLRQKKLKQARTLCVDILENNSDDELIPLALRLLRSTYTGDELIEYKGFVKNGNNSRKGTLAKGLLRVDAAIYEENPLVFLDSVATEYAKKIPAEQALYKKALYQLMVLSDREGAKASKLRLETDFPQSAYLTDLTLLLSDSLTGRNTPVNPGLGKSNPETANSVVYEYNLYNNYPNPFNPETVIKFSLKEKSSVTLTVYNITGQKVAELVTGEMEKGFYNKKFDGTKLSSGVYIFRIEAQSLESKTTYSKTVKALLLK